VGFRRGLAQSRANLARQLHVSPDADLRALPDLPVAEIPARIERLYRLAAAVRPDLQGRFAAVARDERQVELARKRYYPNVQLGVAYNLITARNAADPLADGRDDVGLYVGFNMPIYRRKLDAAVCEAQARTLSDARQYDYDRDQAYSEIRELYAEAEAQRDTGDLLENNILPKSEQALEVAQKDYATGDLDFLTLNTARQDVLRLQVQVARLKADLNRTVAALERAVGAKLNEHPPKTESVPTTAVDSPPPPENASPFRQMPTSTPSPIERPGPNPRNRQLRASVPAQESP
jgi:cobalt-zinc-cadmium efflux system outer membrane protein